MKAKVNSRSKFYTQSSRQSQKGVALITALIITSIAVSLATLIIYRQQIQIRLSSNISALEQNYQYAYGMEDFAGTILKRSWEDQPEPLGVAPLSRESSLRIMNSAEFDDDASPPRLKIIKPSIFSRKLSFTISWCIFWRVTSMKSTKIKATY